MAGTAAVCWTSNAPSPKLGMIHHHLKASTKQRSRVGNNNKQSALVIEERNPHVEGRPKLSQIPQDNDPKFNALDGWRCMAVVMVPGLSGHFGQSFCGDVSVILFQTVQPDYEIVALVLR